MAQVESKNRATSDPDARKKVLKEIKERGIEDVLLWFTDVEGHLKSFSITTSEVEGALDDGMASTARPSPASTRSRSRTWSRSRIRRPSACCPTA